MAGYRKITSRKHEPRARQWLWRAAHRGLAPMQKVASTLRLHRAGVLAWIRLRISNGALEGMNNKTT
jgi:transposase